MTKLKFFLFLVASLLISTGSYANVAGEDANTESFVLDIFDDLEAEEKEAETNPKVLELKKEISYLESALEKYMNTPMNSGSGSAYRTTLSFGAEDELNSTL